MLEDINAWAALVALAFIVAAVMIGVGDHDE